MPVVTMNKVSSWWPSASSTSAAAAAVKEGAATTDEQGRTLGLEDPNDPRLRDDPAILRPLSSSSQNLLPSRGTAYVDPRRYSGGSMLNQSNGLGEPLNVIISALSSPQVLTRKGLQAYLRSLDFDMECFGLHSGQPQRAFLDPRGWVDENFLYRQVYTPFDHVFGTCLESLKGGNHLRAWQQQGTAAWFFAVSKEENVLEHHMIVPDGYNVGRDALVRQTNQDENGITSFMFTSYATKVDYVTDLLPQGTQGINHGIAIDGRVALLTVKVLSSADKRALTKVEQQTTQRQRKVSILNKLVAKRRSVQTQQKPAARVAVTS